MAHLYVTIAVYGFIYGIITRLTRLHYQHGPAVISFYTFTSISVYILAWSHVAGNDPYARVWVHDAPLGVITAAVLSVFMWLGKTATRVTLYGWAHRHSAGSLRLELDLGPERARGAAARPRRAPGDHNERARPGVD